MVRVDTDTGVTGYGYGGGGVAGVAVVNGHLRDLLIGREIGSVADIQATYDMLYLESLPYGRKGLGVMALFRHRTSPSTTCWARRETCPYALFFQMRRNRIFAPMPQEKTPGDTEIWDTPPTSSDTVGQAAMPTTTRRCVLRHMCARSSARMR